MSTTGHETEAINVRGLKASLKKGGNIGIFNECICSTAGGTAAKVTNTVPPSFSLVSGAKIIVKFTYAITVANATLQVGETAAKPIRIMGSALDANIIKAGTSVLLSYDGTAYNIIGGVGGNDVDVSYDTTNKKITKTINGVTSDVVTATTIVTYGGAAIEPEVEIGETAPTGTPKLFVDEDADPAVSIDVYTRAQTDTMLANKVDKVKGKGLSTNDFTTEEKTKLAGIATGATKVTTLDDISDGSSRKLANYLPLSGGTVTGTLTINSNPNVKSIIYFRGWNDNELQGYVGRGGGSINDIMLVGLNGNNVRINGGALVLETGITNTDKTINLVECSTDGYVSYGSGNTGNTNIYGGNILLCDYDGGNVRALINSTGMGIGTTFPSYKLHVAGAVGATAFTNTSDIRKKDIIENLNLDVEDIANAPIFKFTWLDPEMPEGVNVGTSAQYWQTIIPEIVSEANDDEKTLSMQYGVAGLVSSVALAKKVVEQEETIKAQEARIKAIEDTIANIQNILNK